MNPGNKSYNPRLLLYQILLLQFKPVRCRQGSQNCGGRWSPLPWDGGVVDPLVTRSHAPHMCYHISNFVALGQTFWASVGVSNFFLERCLPGTGTWLTVRNMPLTYLYNHAKFSHST